MTDFHLSVEDGMALLAMLVTSWNVMISSAMNASLNLINPDGIAVLALSWTTTIYGSLEVRYPS